MAPSWEAIKTEYITGTISYRKLAAKWGVSFRTLAERAKREQWNALRSQHQTDIVTRTAQMVIDVTSATHAGRLFELQQAADKMAKAILSIFNDEAQFNRYIVGKEEKVFQKIDTRAIKDLAWALKDLSCVMRNVYDLPTAQERQAMDIATERLKLEQKKADAVTVEDSETGVIELAPVLEVAGGE